MKRWVGVIAASAVAVAATGCSSSEPANGGTNGILNKLGKDEKTAIKVLYYDKNSFFQQYGNLFMSKFPNIDVDVISTQSVSGPNKDPEKELKTLIDQEKPDVLLFQSPEQFGQFIEEGRLYPLDDVVKQDKFDIENLLPAVVDAIRAKGDGKLFGLSPEFYGQALYYNKDLFEKYGVPLPSNQMSWNDVLNLAKRFPTDGQGDERVYGLSAFSYMGDGIGYQLMNSIGMTEGLTYLDPENMQVTLQTDGWKQALETAVDAVKSGVLYIRNNDNQSMNNPGSYEDFLLQNQFVAGKAAMTIDGNYIMQNLQEAKERLKDKFKPFNWDTVTVPVNPQNKEYSTSVTVTQIFGINAQSSNLRAAWEFVKYINGDEFARIMSKSSQNLQTRTSYSKEKDGHSLEAFYLLKPNPDSPYEGYDKIPTDFFQSFNGLANQEIKAVIDGKQSAEQALNAMQNKGQEALMKAKQAEDSKKAAEAASQPSS
ncbi:ABC transporter substrate-binding protein [Paenibacillus hexagrammi]|uniref:Extracellular solute-binding protein n=1 Tax=Paenibacillus hexagrammi TaxID=2908839 RepID=A0ABY3SHJ6_9BACL|nr:extracellular solute-binding protein [Paenibacillus sp. YPD9-1]UJF32850.1 extracellular solute-binding protein [Paenibacillus sp. YPD9-1]